MDRRNCTLGWDQRIARARALSVEDASAREALTFYAGLAEYQRSLFVAAAGGAPEGDFADVVDIESASAAVPGLLDWLARAAPARLKLAADALRDTCIDWPHVIRDSLVNPHSDTIDAERAFVAEALLQPYAEAAALHRPRHRSRTQTAECPVCSGLPCVGILREEGQGAKRLLLCARCLTEWEYLRVVCPHCGEERFDALPVYTTEACPHVRIEACDTCRTYLKTIDLTRNGLAVPLVDDIASVALDLWALERGYRRLRGNLLRTSEARP